VVTGEYLEGVVMVHEVRRVHYFAGRLLTPEDFEADQTYHREMRYLHNRLRGHGIARGLTVTAADDGSVVVSPGVAIDARGREVVLVDEVRLDVSATPDGRAASDVCIRWDQVPDAYVPAVGPDGTGAAFTRWLERPRVILEPAGQADDECLLLARLKRRGTQPLAVDLSVRRELHLGASQG
jgi:hypothetical protein